MSNADYLKKYLDPVPEQSDFKQVKKKKKSKKKVTNKVNIIDSDILPWNDINSKEMIENDRLFADVGGDAPQVVTFEKDKSEVSKDKWKKSALTERFDSSDTDDSDSDADVDRNTGEKNGSTALRYDSSDSDDSDLDVRAGASEPKKSKHSIEMMENGHVIPEGQAATIFRDKTGRRHNILEQRKADEEKAKKRLEREDQWKKWGKGVMQEKIREAEADGALYEESKPLARYADDQDLAVYQKSIKRLDDPMEKYFREKAEKRRKKAGGMPIYKGSWDQNRYNVRPGYRWDGVDRGNGFEKRYFRSLNAKKALKEYEIQYLTEDM